MCSIEKSDDDGDDDDSRPMSQVCIWVGVRVSCVYVCVYVQHKNSDEKNDEGLRPMPLVGVCVYV